jgi:hypothetical protein
MVSPSPNTPGLSPLSRCPSLKPRRDGCSSSPPLPPPQFTLAPRLSRLTARPWPHLPLVAHALAFPSPRSPGSARPPAPAHDATRLPSTCAVRLNPHCDNVPPASILRGCDPPPPARPTLQHALPFPLRPRRRPTGSASRWGSGT